MDEQPKLSDRVKAHNTKAKSRAAALLGSEGGKAKVPKGFSMKSPEERANAGRAGMVKRWRKSVTFQELTVCLLPRDADRVMEAATAILAPQNQVPKDLKDAVLALVLDAIAPYGLFLLVENNESES